MTQPHVFTVTLNSDNLHHGHLILVNRQYPIRWQTDDGILLNRMRLIDGAHNNMMLENTAAKMFAKLLKACNAEHTIVPVSGFRSKAEQKDIYDQSLLENGQVFTSQYVARPNESEHQTGLAIDVGEKKEEIDFICPSFPDHGVCRMFRQRASQYGFIKQYIEYVKNYEFHQEHLLIDDDSIEIYYVKATDTVTHIPVVAGESYEISGNNVDGFIITVFHQEACNERG
ncbi:MULTISPECIES: D-alanyl-D-alanine carboxypeptidase family protein [Brevibacillus]|uniref:D-alanyl-D-alanine carboxypeptidase family protein n=1 Tax=Brevibacillus TaxID=55080 RepID=UPI000D0E696D|nr:MULTISPECIES: D-alanyl-D-alanine carboxypeptidase family protein [Brevibacillus]MED1945442.1 D-alanyl-D-alanine carboxypeptidase family protein [Brevibacillus formosus]MED1998435.1 D-alanyl-D-alanine carboxypeptidase family protein [Brevibacillus formosus]MED2080998.1 D-alanyl-D-alanine carboxypeptidase family protein [Brevibacillus formosus]PSK16241.1 peptidase [Brevibacillus sp. NRRL NRS-603]